MMIYFNTKVQMWPTFTPCILSKNSQVIYNKINKWTKKEIMSTIMQKVDEKLQTVGVEHRNDWSYRSYALIIDYEDDLDLGDIRLRRSRQTLSTGSILFCN